MSYIHTPDGFRKDFLKKLIQSGAAPMSIAAYGSKEGILGETYPEDTFSEFLGFKAPRPVVKLDTKWGKVFIYSVKCDGSEDNGDFKPEDFVKKVNEIVTDISEIKSEDDFVDFLAYHLDPSGMEGSPAYEEEEGSAATGEGSAATGGRNYRSRNYRHGRINKLRGGSSARVFRTKKLYSGKEVGVTPLVVEGIVILSELIAKHDNLKVLLSSYTRGNPICEVTSEEDGDDRINVTAIDGVLNSESKDKLKDLSIKQILKSIQGTLKRVIRKAGTIKKEQNIIR
jgi:hypothetical protein